MADAAALALDARLERAFAARGAGDNRAAGVRTVARLLPVFVPKPGVSPAAIRLKEEGAPSCEFKSSASCASIAEADGGGGGVA